MPTLEVISLPRENTWQHSYLLVFLHLQTGSVETFDSSSQWSRMISHQNFYPWTPGNKVSLYIFISIKETSTLCGASLIKELLHWQGKGKSL